MFRKPRLSCCQLVAAINARIFLGGSDISEEEFEQLIDVAKCRYGAALRVKDCYPQLGLIYEDGPVKEMSLEWVKEHLPVEIGYSDDKYGFHSALVIAVEGDEVVLVNASWDRKKWAEIYFYPHDYNRRLRSFKISPIQGQSTNQVVSLAKV